MTLTMDTKEGQKDRKKLLLIEQYCESKIKKEKTRRIKTNSTFECTK